MPRWRVQGSDECLRHLHEELLIASAVGGAPDAGIGEQQVHVAGKIELAAAELAERDDDQPLLAAIFVQRCAVAFNLPLEDALQRRVDEGVGHVGSAGDRLLEIRETQCVAPNQARHEAVAQSVQRRGEFLGLPRIGQGCIKGLRHRGRIRRALPSPFGDEASEPLAIQLRPGRQEVARRQRGAGFHTVAQPQ